MKRRRDFSVGVLVESFLREQGLEARLAEHRVVSAWKSVVGERAARATTQLFVRNETLHATISSAAVRNELFMRRSEIITRLNQVAGRQAIRDLYLH